MARRRSRRVVRSTVSGSRAGRDSVITDFVTSLLPRPIAAALLLGRIQRRQPSVPSSFRRRQSRRFFPSAIQSETRRRYIAHLSRESARAARLRMARQVFAKQTSFCRSRQTRRSVMFAAGVAGIGGPRWSRMMRGARHSGVSCR